MILVLEKVRTRRAPNLGYRESKPLGWFDVSPKDSALNLRHKQVHCHDEAANHQLPIAAALWIIWIVSVEKCSSLMWNLMQIHCSTPSVIFNMMATQYTCSFNGVYHPYWLVRWSCHCSCMHIPVHSLWLMDYIDVIQTFLIILKMVGRFFRQTSYSKKPGFLSLFITLKLADIKQLLFHGVF